MLLREVEYARPSTVDEAVALLASHDGARALAGGQTLAQRDEGTGCRARRARRPARPRRAADDLVLQRTSPRSSSARWSRAPRSSPRPKSRWRGRCSPRWRGRSPTSRCETAAPSAATSASTIRRITSHRCSSRSTRRSRSAGQGGERVVGAEEFFLGVYTTAVEEGELLTKVSVPTRKPGTGDAMTGLTLGAHGTYVVSAAATVGVDGARVALGCVAATPVRASGMEARARRRGLLRGVGARRGRGSRCHDRSACGRARVGRVPPRAGRDLRDPCRAASRRASEELT